MTIEKIIKGILEFIKTIAIVLIIAFVLKTFIVQTFYVDGNSMEPSFRNGEYILINKFVYRLREPKRGDVIVFIPDSDPSRDYIKRIIGLPGDTVDIKAQGVFVNSKKISEPYLINSTANNANPQHVVIKKGYYFVMGDNRNNSKDSRSIGPIARRSIVGRTFVVIFPFKQMRIVHVPAYRAIAAPI